MERRVMGKTGMEVSVLGFGGAEIGFENAALSDVEALLGSALDAGLNVIDTAECYNNSEELIGQAVSHRRNEFFLFTKCGHAHGFDEPDWDIAMLEKSIDRSLKNLRVDHVDLIQLHTCSEEMLRKGEVIEVLQRARAAGKTRFIGYSGDRNDARYAVECGAFDTLQTSLNIAEQQPVGLYLPLALEKQMGVIAKRPIANAAWIAQPPEGSYSYPYFERLQKLDYPFLKNDDAIGVALRWTLSQPGVHTAIVGTKNPARWMQNAQLLDAGPLSQDEIAAIATRWQEVAGDDWVGQS
jgi:aryl-alcohol dehydrogenase-like predicted oxidoreductase